jgi:ankyrin repeat protein
MDGDYWVKTLAIRNEACCRGEVHSTGKTRLHHAAMTGDVERIGQLLEAGAVVDSAWEFRSQVRDSFRNGAAASIDYLNEWRMEISTQLKITPASLAVAFGQKAAYHALLEGGASPSLFEVFPSMCLTRCQKSGPCYSCLSTRQHVLSDEAKVNRHSLLLYLAGAGNGTKPEGSEKIESFIQFNEKDPHGLPPPAPLPAGWYSAMAEVSGKEHTGTSDDMHDDYDENVSEDEEEEEVEDDEEEDDEEDDEGKEERAKRPATSGLVPHVRLLKAGIEWDLLDIVTLSIDGGIDELNEELEEWTNQDAFMGTLEEHKVAENDAFTKVLFPRISCDFLPAMMRYCGIATLYRNSAFRDLLRQLVGFPDTLCSLDDRLSGWAEGYGVSVALYAACCTGDLELVRAILPMEGVSLGHSEGGTGELALLVAAMGGHRDIIHFIIDPDNRPYNFEAEDLDLALLVCVMIGDLQLTCGLLREGAEPRWNLEESIPEVEDFSTNCLRGACALANVEMVKLLLNNPWCCAQVTTSELRQGLPEHHHCYYDLQCVCQPKRFYHLPFIPFMPPASAEDDARRVEVIRLRLAAVSDAACVPLYVN